jgi:hypothetical protein
VLLLDASMDQWRERLLASRELILEDDDEDDFNVNWIMGLGFNAPRIVQGSRPGKSPNIDRHRHEMHARMMSDYFADEPVYGPSFFRRRYRMRRSLFLTILERVCARDDYFVQRIDACGFLGLSPHQKITSALRMLCYGLCADATDEYCRTSETTAMRSLK